MEISIWGVFMSGKDADAGAGEISENEMSGK